MANHPNRNWRKKWNVDIEQCLAVHQDGWMFQFSEVENGVWEGKAISFPKISVFEQMKVLSDITSQASRAWNEVLKDGI